MDPVNKTIYIPLYGKAFVSRRGIFLREAGRKREMTPRALTGQLRGAERWIFRRLYAGSVSRKMYRLYEFRSETAGTPENGK